MRLAAIDLGTVTARLLVADVDEAGIHEIHRHMLITHLGENLAQTGRIAPAAIEREVAACAEFIKVIRRIEEQENIPVQHLAAVATSAMRDATNSKEVCAALRQAGVDVEVIGGDREAQLSFQGAVSGFAGSDVVLPGSVLTLDVGGGSTEVIAGIPARADAALRIIQGHSFDIGCRRVTDRFFRHDPPTKDELSRAESWIESEMTWFFAELGSAYQTAIAVAGTATTTVTVRDAIKNYDPWKVHGTVVSDRDLTNVLNKLSKIDQNRRRRVVGLEPDRAPVILAGLIILRTALRLAVLDSFVVSETDILQGILLDWWVRRGEQHPE